MDMVPLIREIAGRELRGLVWRGIVEDIQVGRVMLRRPGEVAADPVPYPRLDSYDDPQVGDEVLLLRVGSGWVVLGRIVR